MGVNLKLSGFKPTPTFQMLAFTLVMDDPPCTSMVMTWRPKRRNVTDSPTSGAEVQPLLS